MTVTESDTSFKIPGVYFMCSHLKVAKAKTHRLRPVLGSVILVVLPCIGHGQGTSGTTYSNLSVTGTTSANEVDVSGTLDVLNNTVLLGSWSTDDSTPGGCLIYSDGTSGEGASFENVLTRPGAAWSWLRQTDSNVAMTLNSSNQLIITGTQSSSPGSIVIDPNAGTVSIDGTPLPTMSEIASEFMPLNPGSFTASSGGFTNVSVEGSQAYVGIDASGAEAALNFEADGSDSGDKSFRLIDRADEVSIDKMNDACTNVAIGGIAQFFSTGDVAIGAGGITFQTDGAAGLATLGSLVFSSNGTEFGSINDGWGTNYVGGYPWSPTRGGQIYLGGGLRGDSAVNGIIFMQNGTEVGRFNNGGDFGIGVSSPGAPLEVSAGTSANLRIGDPDYGGLVVGSNNNGYETDFVGGAPTGNPTTSNSMGGEVRLGGSTRGDNMINGIQFLQNGAEVMRINNGGNVGIGTSAPHAALAVNGSVIVTGSLNTTTGTVVASGTNLVLIPQQGDLSMGSFTAGATPQ